MDTVREWDIEWYVDERWPQMGDLEEMNNLQREVNINENLVQGIWYIDQ